MTLSPELIKYSFMQCSSFITDGKLTSTFQIFPEKNFLIFKMGLFERKLTRGRVIRKNSL